MIGRRLAALALLLSPAPVLAASDRVELASDLRVRVREGRAIELEVLASPDETWASLAERVATREAAAALRGPGGGERPEAGAWVAVPLALLDDSHRSLVLRTLFPRDRLERGDWLHVARSGPAALYDAGLWQVAEWFTGRGENFTELLAENALSSPELAAGRTIRIPARLLHPALRPRPRSSDGSLEFGRDARGDYAGYRLAAGEALYSAVVVRFTGRTKAEDVVAVAERLAERSAIRDLRDIPIGFEIKIPFDLLEPAFLPAGDPRRAAAEAAEAELASELAREPIARPRRGLEGVVVILDAGHGGRDLGTLNHGLWEHDYVYDVVCRLKRRLEGETAARVHLTLEDRETGCAPSAGDRLVANRQGTILTRPPFLAREEGEAEIAVNLRWYLANSILRRETADGVKPDRVVFVSVHADSRHPSLGGVMVYVPGADYRAKRYGFASKTYRRYAEVREEPFVRFTRQERVRSEAVSRRLAGRIVEAFGAAGLPVQPYQPVRHRIIRGRQTFVPAVLRGNAVPTKILVELVNMAKPDDAKLLGRSEDRERLAGALASALKSHFGE